MSFARQFMSLFLCSAIAFSPVLVEARAGSKSSRSGGSTHQSMGSSGSKTHNNRAGKPIERSMTPKPSPTPAQTPRPVSPVSPAPAPMAQPNFFQRNPILSGVMGGLAGSFIGNMLFNHSRSEAGQRNDNNFDSPDASPTGRALGSMLPFVFIIGLILLGVWLYRRNASQQSLASNMSSTGYNPESAMPMRSDNDNWNTSSTIIDTPTTTALRVDSNDTLAFADLLVDIQSAWDLGDLLKLQRLVTPEMLVYFSEILADNTSQGVKNRIQRVKVEKLELKDAWEESNMQYASSLLTWSAVDYTVKLDKSPGDEGYLTDGDMQKPVEISEIWTFARSRKGGNWLLSAIQQL